MNNYALLFWLPSHSASWIRSRMVCMEKSIEAISSAQRLSSDRVIHTFQRGSRRNGQSLAAAAFRSALIWNRLLRKIFHIPYPSLPFLQNNNYCKRVSIFWRRRNFPFMIKENQKRIKKRKTSACIPRKRFSVRILFFRMPIPRVLRPWERNYPAYIWRFWKYSSDACSPDFPKCCCVPSFRIPEYWLAQDRCKNCRRRCWRWSG